MPKCSRCGEFHATPRQNKNCERRSRSTSAAVPTAVQAVLPQKFDESAVYSAYLSWQSSLEDKQEEESTQLTQRVRSRRPPVEDYEDRTTGTCVGSSDE